MIKLLKLYYKNLTNKFYRIKYYSSKEEDKHENSRKIILFQLVKYFKAFIINFCFYLFLYKSYVSLLWLSGNF